MEKFYCNKCKISVVGQNTCPLCGTYIGDLIPQNKDNVLVDLGYPKVNSEIIMKNIIFRVLILISIISTTICVFINLLFTPSILWCTHIAVSWAVFWLTIGRTIFFNLQLRRQIVWDCIFLCLLVLYMEFFIAGFIGGAGFIYAIPIIIVGCLLSSCMFMVIHYKKWEKYALPTSVLCILTLVPMIISLCIYGVSKTSFTMYICAGCGIVTQLCLMFLGREKYWSELKKKYHI